MKSLPWMLYRFSAVTMQLIAWTLSGATVQLLQVSNGSALVTAYATPAVMSETSL